MMSYASNINKMNVLWLDSPFFHTLLDSTNYDFETKGQIRRFRDEGFLLFDSEIPDEKLDRVIQDSKDEYLNGGRIQDAWKDYESVREIATWKKILDFLKIFYQRDPIPFQTLNFPIGSEQKTHSDIVHFHSFPPQFMCGAWVALEDVDSNNGPLHYYKRSHKLPIFDMHDLGIQASYGNYPKYEEFFEEMMAATDLERVDVTLRKGQAIIWAANLFHGGSAILDNNRTRYSQVTHYFFSDCIYYTPMYSDPFLGKLALREISDIKTGKIVYHFYNGRRIKRPETSIIIRAVRFVINSLKRLFAWRRRLSIDWYV